MPKLGPFGHRRQRLHSPSVLAVDEIEQQSERSLSLETRTHRAKLVDQAPSQSPAAVASDNMLHGRLGFLGSPGSAQNPPQDFQPQVGHFSFSA
jgi:hypothetical protein